MSSKGKHLAILVSTSLLVISGCIPVKSIHPLYDEQTLSLDDALLGRWIEDSNKPQDYWQFTRLRDTDDLKLLSDHKELQNRAYALTLYEKGKAAGYLVACRVRLGGVAYLDLSPAQLPSGITDEEQMKYPFNTLFLLPCHTFLKVEQRGGQLTLNMTDDGKMKELLKEDANAVEYTTLENEPLLTASTAELQGFVKRFTDHEKLFCEEIVLKRLTQ